ncbi:universal stress protein [Roseobacter sp. YSTF-M11]|uniref:Universal stress protein n=1 Tax=Roseobacter insulae TaxID=2859783 RepID=A0A9X1K4T0_9RHOB|nr:universal stress protein [Roseobacter insulae]MBW4710022.1 universal stress protein [Roseobacter insulae]
MSRSVLCAIDVSHKGRDAAVLKMAKKLADLDGASLDVVTVVPDFGQSIVSTYFESDHHEKAVAEARQLLSDEITASLGADTDAMVRHVVATGSAYEEILHVAQETDCGLIVIGAHKPDFKDYLLGPNAARVVRHSNCSVHVVR